MGEAASENVLTDEEVINEEQERQRMRNVPGIDWFVPEFQQPWANLGLGRRAFNRCIVCNHGKNVLLRPQRTAVVTSSTCYITVFYE